MSPLALLALILAASAGRAERPLFRSAPEISVRGEAPPSQALAQFTVDSLPPDDVRNLNACLTTQRLPSRAYARLLSAVRIPLAAGRTLWFVRPARAPWCQALYGAHLFRHFLVEEQAGGVSRRYRNIFMGGGDGFAVYPRRSHGVNDIETTGCTARDCVVMRWVYAGFRYGPSQCHRDIFRNGRVVRRARCPRSMLDD